MIILSFHAKLYLHHHTDSHLNSYTWALHTHPKQINPEASRLSIKLNSKISLNLPPLLEYTILWTDDSSHSIHRAEGVHTQYIRLLWAVSWVRPFIPWQGSRKCNTTLSTELRILMGEILDSLSLPIDFSYRTPGLEFQDYWTYLSQFTGDRASSIKNPPSC